MIRNIVIFLLFLFPLIALGQLVQLDKSEFYKLKIQKNKWICEPEYPKDSLISFHWSGRQKAYKLKVIVDKYELDTMNKLIHISGFVKGGWYGAASSVKIYIGCTKEKVVNMYIRGCDRADSTYLNGKLITEPVPIVTTINMYLVIKSKFQTPDGFKNKNEKRPFDLSFKYSNKDKLIFALWDCYAETFDLGKIN